MSFDPQAMLTRFRERAAAVRKRPCRRSPVRSANSSSPKRTPIFRILPWWAMHRHRWTMEFSHCVLICVQPKNAPKRTVTVFLVDSAHVTG